jgi:hypothetical protein
VFSLLLIKFKSLNIRTRLLAGLSVCLVSAVIFIIPYYCLVVFDGLSRVASSKTVFYLHWNFRPADNLYRLKVTDSLLNKFGLQQFDRHLIGSELAIICDDYQKKLDCGLALKTNNSRATEKFLADHKIVYKKLKNKVFIIGGRSEWIKQVTLSYNPFNFLNLQSVIGQSNELTIAFRISNNLTNDLEKIFYLTGSDKTIKISGAITSKGIALRLAEHLNVFKQSQSLRPPEADCDLFFLVAKPIKNGITDFILSQLIDQKNDLLSSFSNQPLAACLKKIGSANNLLTDYDINFRSPASLDNSAQAKIEQALLRLASRLEPLQKTTYLNDGTKVIELFANTGGHTITKTSNAYSLKLADGREFNYSISESGFNLSNNPSNLNKILPAVQNNYFFVRINALPKSVWQKYLSDFSYLMADDSGLLIK